MDKLYFQSLKQVNSNSSLSKTTSKSNFIIFFPKRRQRCRDLIPYKADVQSPLQAFQINPTVLEICGSISVSKNNTGKIYMLFQHFSNLKAMSVNIPDCLRKTQKLWECVMRGIYFSCSFPNAFKSTTYRGKIGCFTTSISTQNA